ncbi:MAG: alpha-1,2-fucosyltransferase [Candidatus Lokiarchaeota archaeon]|nr:alpha-1,2-fucosyltransferase [Candidatus Lokiarchaeota archaeon]
MVIVKLIGGLGNQLFQYAAGRAVSYRNRTSLKLDISQFKHYPNRSYYLNFFSVSAAIIPTIKKELLIKDFGDSRTGKLVSLFLNLFSKYQRHHIFSEQGFSYDPDILKVPENVYLNGYWQSEKYFKDIEHIIRDEFIISTTPNSENQSVAKMINEHNSVSLHIRRGDYLANIKQEQYHGVCSLEYYHAAIEYLQRIQKDPHFFVFSDDISWAKEKIKISNAVNFVDHNGPERPYEDLRLMTLCKHHIIANSTFSWWGAWLSEFQDKIVIAPRKWFNHADNDTNDLIPPSWIQL